MSAKSRCPRCQHLRGPRGLNVAKQNPKRMAFVGKARKKSCACGCHVFGGPGLHLSTAPITDAEMGKALDFAREHGFTTEEVPA